MERTTNVRLLKAPSSLVFGLGEEAATEWMERVNNLLDGERLSIEGVNFGLDVKTNPEGDPVGVEYRSTKDPVFRFQTHQDGRLEKLDRQIEQWIIKGINHPLNTAAMDKRHDAKAEILVSVYDGETLLLRYIADVFPAGTVEKLTDKYGNVISVTLSLIGQVRLDTIVRHD